MHLRPATIRRLTRHRRSGALELSRRARLSEAVGRAVHVAGRPAFVLGTSVVAGVGVLYLPGWTSFGRFHDAPAARSFLSTLWQVEGGTIALSLTLILVAFEAIWRGRFRGSVRRFAEEVWLLYAVAFAFASLLAIGWTLLGWGTDAPGGWAATWATILSALAFGAVPLVLVRTLLLMNPAMLHQRRLEQVRAEVRDAVDEEAFERLAYGELKEAASGAVGLRLTPVLDWEPRGDRVAIQASRDGIVRDIKIGRLARIAKKLASGDTNGITVGTRLDAYVAQGAELALVAHHASRWQRGRIGRTFEITGGPTRSRLHDVIAQIHQEALHALREVEPDTYDDVAELWIELLLALPAAWRRYGHDYDNTVAGSFAGVFGRGPVDAVARNLYIEAREATKAMDDLAADAFSLPDIVSRRCADIDASALVQRMLALYVDLYSVAAELDNERLRDRLLHLVFELPAQFARFTDTAFRDSSLTSPQHRRAHRYLHLSFRGFMEQMKAVADHDPTQTNRIGRIDSSWTDIFSNWFPEQDREEEWPGLAEDELARRRDHNAQIDAVVSQKEALERLRDAYRFAVAYWALHQLQTTRGTDWRGVIDSILPWLGNPERLAAEAEQVVAIDLDDHIFMQWHDSPVQMGWAAPRAFIVFSLLRHPPAQVPANVGRRNFLRHGMANEIEQILVAVAADDQLWELFGGRPEDLADRVEALRVAIRASAAIP